MKKIKKAITQDLYRYTGNKKISWVSKRRLYGWQYTRIWRKANYYQGNKLLFLVYGFLLLKKSIRFGFQISPYATIGKGLYIGHFGTVIVSNDAILGDNVNLSPNVIIGRTNRGEKWGAPNIGSNVWIGSGAVIVGQVSIGDNVLIAPNSYVNFNVPSDSIVIGNPAIVHKNTNATVSYIDNRI